MCIRDSIWGAETIDDIMGDGAYGGIAYGEAVQIDATLVWNSYSEIIGIELTGAVGAGSPAAVSYTHLESYNMSSTESIFQKKMRGNLIDRHYHNEFSLATTTAEFCELQKKYIDIWKNELDFAVDKFNNILTPTDKEDFFQIQKAWESSTLDQINFERDYISNQEEYNICLLYTS